MIIDNWKCIDYDQLDYNVRWEENESSRPLSMHTIHSYPAKFPSFLAAEAFAYAEEEGIKCHKVSDIFCGCGTVALEAKIRDIPFWGCDINPVATLIARVKAADYETDIADELYQSIIDCWDRDDSLDNNPYINANERLKYWFNEETYNHLFGLLKSIRCMTKGNELYCDAFLCLFSSILKTCSKWLQKSIKPQLDPEKIPTDVRGRFRDKYRQFRRATIEMKQEDLDAETEITIVQDNFLSIEDVPEVDLIITSPPYVTSYEYADLHQLSTLWLQYTDDYRTLRRGSIGSVYNSGEWNLSDASLNNTASKIVLQMQNKGLEMSKIKSVARYYSDMQVAVNKCAKMLSPTGMAFFVIGDSEVKGVELKNSQHLVECLQQNGLKNIKMEKRKISKGICVPYRDKHGRFTKESSSNSNIYHEEFIISGRKA